MFRWQKELDRLDLQVKQILDLRRSLNRVQLSLSGLPSQEATAYLSVFAAGKGVRGAVVLHLHASDRLAIFLNEEGEVPRTEAASLASQGAAFAESLGFMVGELDWPTLSSEKRGSLWESLPLKKGGKPAAPRPAKTPPPPVAGGGAMAAGERKSPPAAPATNELSGTGEKRPEAAPEGGGSKASPVETEKLSVLAPPAVPSVTKEMPGIEAKASPSGEAHPLPLRQRRQPPTTMEERRRKFRENFGRFLASL